MFNACVGGLKALSVLSEQGLNDVGFALAF